MGAAYPREAKAGGDVATLGSTIFLYSKDIADQSTSDDTHVFFSTVPHSLRVGTRKAVISALSPATRKEFSESNDPTIDAFLRDSLGAALAQISVGGHSRP